MRPLEAMTAAEAAGLSAIFTDIDGTITDPEGRIPSSTFVAMERARSGGLAVVPITGRPAGWCDLIARTWPVDGVVGENGGLYFRRQAGADGTEGMDRVFVQDEALRATHRARLTDLAAELLERHPGAALASDQQYREFDIAVDFCEDVPPLPSSEIDEIVSFLEAAGCHVKVSNIHVNAWFGDFDKASMCRRYVRDRWGWDLNHDAARAAFFGDSPNDSPLFALFPLGIGVANVSRMAHRMDALPAFVTRSECAAGFAEGIDRILQLRS